MLSTTAFSVLAQEKLRRADQIADILHDRPDPAASSFELPQDFLHHRRIQMAAARWY
jgi:hypothetical protein